MYKWGLDRKLSSGLAAILHPQYCELRDVCKSIGAWSCDDECFLKITKECHEALLVNHVLDGHEKSLPEEGSKFLYLHNLAGRGLFDTKRTSEEEVEYRQNSWLERKAMNEKTNERDQKTWNKRVREFTQKLLQNFAEDDLSRGLTSVMSVYTCRPVQAGD